MIVGTIAGGLTDVTGPHLHFEVRTGLPTSWYTNDAHNRGCKAGYYLSVVDMNLDYLTLNPTKFIDEHRVATWHPAGTLMRTAGDNTVYYLQNGKRRGVTSPQALLLWI